MKKRFVSSLMAMTMLPTSIVSSAWEAEKEPDTSLWKKFLKYDLCITDYDSLTNAQKELCHFIFDTEQSTTDSIRCERARRILNGEDVGERLTVEELNGAWSIGDSGSDDSVWGFASDIDCVPDVKRIDVGDKDVCYNEYWLNEEGTEYVRFRGENESPFYWEGFQVHTADGDYEIPVTEGYLSVQFERYEKEDGEYYRAINGDFVEHNGDYYSISPENKAVLIKSQYSRLMNISSDETPLDITVIIPDEVNGCPVTEICAGAFQNSLITGVQIPDTVESIGDGAFAGCDNLSKVNIPENIQRIGIRAFWGCAIEKLELNNSNLKIQNGAFLRCEELKEAYLNVGYISDEAFYGCKNLKTLKLGDSITKIGAFAFEGCESIEDLVIPTSVRAIGAGAFSFNYFGNGVKEVTIPPSVEILGAVPKKTVIGAAGSGMGEYINNPLTDEYGCVFDKESVVIYGYIGTEAERYAEEWELKFVPIETENGDVNLDGTKNSVADMVTLQKYVMGRYVRTGAYYGDLNSDGKVNSLDISVMRKDMFS